MLPCIVNLSQNQHMTLDPEVFMDIDKQMFEIDNIQPRPWLECAGLKKINIYY